MTFTITGGNTIPVASGTYKASLTEVEVRVDGGFEGKGFRIWRFLADVNGELTPVEGSTSPSNGVKSKAYEWLTAIMGSAPMVGESIDPIGRTCLVTIGQANGYPRVVAVAPYASPDQVLEGVPR